MMLGLHSNASQESEHSQNSLFSSDVPNSMELFSQPNSSQSQSQTTAGIPHLHSQIHNYVYLVLVPFTPGRRVWYAPTFELFPCCGMTNQIRK